MIRSDRRYRFDVDPDALWGALATPDGFRRAWPWLREFDGERLAPGEAWHCAVRAPLPYTLHFTVRIDDVIPSRAVVATITGDITGTARFDVAPDGDGSTLRLRSELAPSSRAFALLAWVAGPLARRSHDHILDTGAAQFRRLAASDEPRGH